MIRTPPQHNTTNPPGQIVNPIQQEKTLAKEIDGFKLDEAYMKGYKEGYAAGIATKFPDLGSEAAR